MSIHDDDDDDDDDDRDGPRNVGFIQTLDAADSPRSFHHYPCSLPVTVFTLPTVLSVP